ncbi:hypothetical protein GHT41_21515 [Citrobacter koseri]|uniref:hypothetical protein n=1 Tax=Citrobacter koseri TaxID=545 RepID=UPI00190867E3|nr:hypothetical protein [Citrobacter koseri]MBJ9356257.1 hypothetical protein [Citrobacter koseri]
MSAMTCFSTAALADVTPHSNTDSVDFAANMTVQGKQCPLTVTKTGDIGFTYTYTQDDADAGALGDMAVDSPVASVTVSTSEGCQIHGLAFDATSRTGLIKVAKNTAAMPTQNGGFIPFVAQLANVTFGDGISVTTAYTPAAWPDDYLHTVTEPAPPSDLSFGSTNNDTKLAGANVPGIAGLAGGYIRTHTGDADLPRPTDTQAVRNGLADLKGPNDNPQAPGHQPSPYVVQYQWAPAIQNTDDPAPDFKATVATFTFTAMVGTTVYSLADKLPDPSAVYDNESLSTTVTYTFTAI